MAKNAGQKAAGKAIQKGGIKKTQKLPRPTYDKLDAELAELQSALRQILQDGADSEGKLDAVQIAQAFASLQALDAARVALKCPQLFGAYRAHG